MALKILLISLALFFLAVIYVFATRGTPTGGFWDSLMGFVIISSVTGLIVSAVALIWEMGVCAYGKWVCRGQRR